MTPTEKLRQQVRQRIGSCPTCGRSGMSLREAAKQIGPPIGAPILSRFLNGNTITSDTFDRLSAWVESPVEKVVDGEH